jgi:hypothetical protein
MLKTLFCLTCYLFILSPVICQSINDIKIPFEQKENYSASYDEGINTFKQLAAASDKLELFEFGSTDIGKPLHYLVISPDKEFNHPENNLVVFVNNAIHPGEPCGVDASLLLARDLAADKNMLEQLEGITIVIIPFYNVGGALNRNSHSRANQNGPLFYGFRGNAKNLDLNRDFIKTDSRNAQSFNQLYNLWNPHVFLDNHTSNGADYQYTLTLIATQKDKLSGPLASLMSNDMLPFLYQKMAKTDLEMTPYVNSNGPPDTGIYGFNETARYSTGYSTLHHAIGFMPETHMLKPFKDRVQGVYNFMYAMLEYCINNQDEIKKAKQKSIESYAAKDSVDIEWTLDKNKKESIVFKGYEAKYKSSEISGINRLYYDRDAPYEKEVDFYNTYKASKTIKKPKAYVVPKTYPEVIQRLKWNDVEMICMDKDTTMVAEVYYIQDYESTPVPYESHYLHYNIQVESQSSQQDVNKGDYLIILGQEKDRFIVETLEPHAPDSFFAWNFFDGILMQKEYFSSYVFEDLAEQILSENPDILNALNKKKTEDKAFAENARAQLDFIYRSSKHYESTHKRYPVLRVVN